MRHLLCCSGEAKPRRGHSKGVLDLLGSSDYPRIGETWGGAWAARRAASIKRTATFSLMPSKSWKETSCEYLVEYSNIIIE